MKYRSETGIVLMLVLIVLVIISLILMQGLELGLKGYKLSLSFKAALKGNQELEQKLINQEIDFFKKRAQFDKMKQEPEFGKQRNERNALDFRMDSLQFIPDHLGFAGKTGVDIFQLRQDHFQSRIAVRVLDPSFASFLTPCLIKVVDLPKCYPKFWYFLRGTDTHKSLSVWDRETGKIISSVRLKENLNQVVLNEAKANYQNKPGTFVVLSGEYSERVGAHSEKIGSENSGSNRIATKSASYVFNVDPESGNLNLNLELTGAIPPQLKNRTQAEFFCISEKDPTWVLAIGGEMEGEAVICFIFLSNPDPEKTRIIKIGSRAAILHFQAVDRESNNIASELYLRDREGRLFKINLQNKSGLTLINQEFKVEKITSIKPLSQEKHSPQVSQENADQAFLRSQATQRLQLAPAKFLVAPDPDGLGIILIMAGENEQSEPGIYAIRIYDANLESDRLAHSTGEGLSFDQPVLVEKGRFTDMRLRFGRLILIPEILLPQSKPESAESKVFELSSLVKPNLSGKTGQETLACVWQQEKSPVLEKIGFAGSEFSEVEKVYLNDLGLSSAFIFWDPILQQEKLMVLNSRCEFKLYSSNLNHDRYGRISWQNLRN